MKAVIGKTRLNVVFFSGLVKQAIGLRFRKNIDLAYMFPIKYPLLSIVDTFFIRHSLDIFFLDKKFRLIKLKKHIKPFRFVVPEKGTRFILEIKSTKSSSHNLRFVN